MHRDAAAPSFCEAGYSWRMWVQVHTWCAAHLWRLHDCHVLACVHPWQGALKEEVVGRLVSVEHGHDLQKVRQPEAVHASRAAHSTMGWHSRACEYQALRSEQTSRRTERQSFTQWASSPLHWDPACLSAARARQRHCVQMTCTIPCPQLRQAALIWHKSSPLAHPGSGQGSTGLPPLPLTTDW